jgi:adenine deaminase
MRATTINSAAEEMIRAARGELRVDLALTGGRLVNVFSGTISAPMTIAIHRGRIVGFGDYEAETVIDVEGNYVAPGFIDGHIHMESSMLSPLEFARAAFPLGTTSVVIDPHEIANVRGRAGIDYMLAADREIPLDIFVMIPSCVPATHLETGGAVLNAADIRDLIHRPNVLGLAELMNFPGVLAADGEMMEKLAAAEGKMVDGHSPMLSGKDLSAYIIAGPSSDHECTTLDEAREKLEKGMDIMIREGSLAKNLAALLPLVTPANHHHFMLVSDDRLPQDLKNEGHLNGVIRKAIEWGLDPLIAISMATINPARHFNIRHRGALAPGYDADLVIFDDFRSFAIERVFKKGTLLAEKGVPLFPRSRIDSAPIRNTVSIAPFSSESLRIPARGKDIHCIGVFANQIVTEHLTMAATIKDGFAVADPERDLAKIAVIERHKASGNVGLAFIKGLGIKRGALATTIAHDSHNIVVAGINDDDMIRAVERIVELQGGIVMIEGGQVRAELPLPLGGLMSDASFEEVAEKMEDLESMSRALGMSDHHSFLSLSFMALPVIPELKLTDRGLVDVKSFSLIGLFV